MSESETIRINVNLMVNPTTAETIRRLGTARNVPNTTLFLQALGILQTVHDATKEGKYVGISPFRDRLETVLLDTSI